MDPHLLIMRKSLVQKRAGERALCVCVSVCIFVSFGGWVACVCVCGVQMKQWMPGNRDRVRGKGWHSTTPLAGVRILSTYQHLADHPCLLLSGWNWLGLPLVSMAGLYVCFSTTGAGFQKRNRCAHFVIHSARVLYIFGVFSHWIGCSFYFSSTHCV